MDETWESFLRWLRQAPALRSPLDAMSGFEADQVRQGASREEAAERLAVVRRLMPQRSDWWPLLFDKIYVNERPTFSQTPSPVLVEALDGLQPGRALDVAMGQGRNAVFLAQRGWAVTGFEPSRAGLAAAHANAAKAGVTIDAAQAAIESFAYGSAHWDLIALIYVPATAHEGAAMTRLTAALKPGGLLVVESFASEKTGSPRRPVDIDPAALRASLGAFELLRFDDVEGTSEWDPQPTRLCRVVARKR